MSPSISICDVRRIVIAVGVMIASLLPARSSSAQSDPGSVLPSTRVMASLPESMDKAKGFTVDILSDGAGGSGYLPVLISIRSTGAFAGDRNFLIRFEPVEFGYSPPQSGISCDIPVTVAQGARQIQVMRSLPKWSVGSGYKIRVFEDGVEFADYEGEIGQLIQRQSRAPTEMISGEVSLNWLYVIASLADQPSAQATVRGLDGQTRSTNVDLPRTVSGVRTIRRPPTTITPITYAPLATLTKDWRQYQSFDGLLINSADLATFAAQYADRYQAIRDWVMMGGTLVVLGADSPEATLQQLNFLSQAATREDDLIEYLGEGEAGTAARRRTLLEQKSAVEAIIAAENAVPSLQTFSRPPAAFSGDPKLELKRIDAELDALNRATKGQPRWQDQMWSQPLAAGRVIGVKSADNVAPTEWRIINRMFGFRKSATLRRGVDPMIGDSRVRRWLIPGVAQPPIYTFIGLLTVFVILVGPVAYRKTTKAGRGYLMFAIAPFLALTTTMAMFTYGVVADGFGTKARVRQLTWVDGSSGDAVERIRSTYFAGVRPADGLRFAGDAEVMGYPDYNGNSWEEMNQQNFLTIGKVRVSADAQVFDSSFLPSRTQQQFVVHRPRHQLGKLTLRQPTPASTTTATQPAPPSEVAAPRTLDSTFDFALRGVVVRDDKGVYWEADQIAAGQRGVVCRPIPLKEISKRLGDLYNQNRPLAEVRRTKKYSSYDQRIRDLTLVINRNLGEVNQMITDGIFEDWLQRRLQVDNALPSGSFIAEADVSQDAIAVEGAALVKSVRYVFGTLP